MRRLCIVAHGAPMLYGYLIVALGRDREGQDPIEIVVDRRHAEAGTPAVERRKCSAVDRELETRGYVVLDENGAIVRAVEPPPKAGLAGWKAHALQAMEPVEAAWRSLPAAGRSLAAAWQILSKPRVFSRAGDGLQAAGQQSLSTAVRARDGLQSTWQALAARTQGSPPDPSPSRGKQPTHRGRGRLPQGPRMLWMLGGAVVAVAVAALFVALEPPDPSDPGGVPDARASGPASPTPAASTPTASPAPAGPAPAASPAPAAYATVAAVDGASAAPPTPEGSTATAGTAPAATGGAATVVTAPSNPTAAATSETPASQPRQPASAPDRTASASPVASPAGPPAATRETPAASRQAAAPSAGRETPASSYPPSGARETPASPPAVATRETAAPRHLTAARSEEPAPRAAASAKPAPASRAEERPTPAAESDARPSGTPRVELQSDVAGQADERVITYTARLSDARGRPLENAEVSLHAWLPDGSDLKARLNSTATPGIYRVIVPVGPRTPSNLRVLVAHGGKRFEIAPQYRTL